MTKFDHYIGEKKIIRSICKIRARLAKQRSKKHLVHLLSTNEKFNYHLNSENHKGEIYDDIELLNKILPSRRQWKKLNAANLYKDNQRINSVEYNEKSILLTIDYFRRKKPNEPFLKELDHFVSSIQDSISDPNYRIGRPTVIPRLKGDRKSKENICRPIAQYGLKDRLIIGMVNKYLTDIFDSYFYSGSHAFRSIQIVDENRHTLTHQDSIQAIVEYKNEYKGKRLWVSECDISKFYDSVHHTIVKRQFRKLISKVKKDKPGIYDERADMFFYKYLDSYSFVKDVRPLNNKGNEDYWIKKHKIPGGRFGWVEKELIKNNVFKKVGNAKIGVPQGGAISGLIANIVLDYADSQVLKLNLSNLLYVRFCDDMILIHPSKRICGEASKVYFEALKELHLVPHDFKSDLLNTSESFWSGKVKSKNPYKWSSNYADAFRWFGFVGYEINYSGDLRVRKSSLRKEKKKQREVIDRILKAVESGKRKSNRYILESAQNRLNGMSVGRITIKNYKTVENDMCWINGFKELTDNKHARAQLKGLDKYRAMQMSKLINELRSNRSNQLNEKVKVKKIAFCSINGITKKDSEIIRLQLYKSEILNSKFELIKTAEELENPKIVMGLNNEFLKYKDEILYVLMNLSENRYVPYYGKPFSYYYHVIDKGSDL